MTQAVDHIGEAQIVQAVRLTEDMLALATTMTDGGMARQLGAILKDMGADGAAMAKSRELAARGAADIDGLTRIRTQIEPLRHQLAMDLVALRALHVMHQGGDALARADQCARVENRSLRLMAIDSGLERCRQLLDRLLASGRLVEDQLVLVRDVTAPIAVRDAGLARLSRAGEKAVRLGRDIDATCEEMIRKAAARRTRITRP